MSAQLHYAVSVTWNGSTITGPVLIYLDEILVDSHTTTDIGDPNRPGALICRSEDRATVSWHFTDGILVTVAPTPSSTTFKQVKSGTGVIPGVSRLSLNRENIDRTDNRTNGLWHCRLNTGSTYDEQVDVGIFNRGK